MRTELVYSLLALGIPVTVNAADVNVTASQLDISVPTADGQKLSKELGTLKPDNYTLVGKIKTRLYKVTIKIGGKSKTIEPDPDKEQDFTLGRHDRCNQRPADEARRG